MTEYSYHACPICGIHYGVDKIVMDYKLKTENREERGWHCPNGHALVFKVYDADVLRRERDLLAQRIAQKDDEIKSLDSMVVNQRGQITKLKKRASAGM